MRTRARAWVVVVAALAVAAPASAQPVGEQFRISETSSDADLTRDAFVPNVASSSTDGNYLAVWNSDAIGGDDEAEIFGQRLGPTAADLGVDFRISTTGPDGNPSFDALFPNAVHNPRRNEYLAVWQADTLPGAQEKFEIFGQRVAADGTELGADFRISTSGADADEAKDALRPAVVHNAVSDEYLVVWVGNGLSNTKREIFGQRLAGDGSELGGDFRISTTGADADVSRSPGNPELAYGPHRNEYLVVWSADALANDNENEVFGQRLAADGSDLGGDFRITQVGAEGDASRGTGSAFVAYNTRQQEWLVVFTADALDVDNDNEAYGQRLAADGAGVGGMFRISHIGPEGDAARTIFRPDVAYSGEGNEYLVAWVADAGAANDDKEAWGQRVEADGTEIGGDFQISSHGPDGATDYPVEQAGLTYQPLTNEYLAVWQGDTVAGANDKYEAYGRRVASSDKTAPVVVVTRKKAQTARKRQVRVGVECRDVNPVCAITAKATVTGLAKSFKLKTVKTNDPVTGSVKVVLRIPRSKLAAILARIRAGRKVLVKVSIRARDAAGNPTDAKATVRLK